jgi:hypothetical protein
MIIINQNANSSEYYWAQCATVVSCSVLLLSCHCCNHCMSWQVQDFCAMQLSCWVLWCRRWRQDLGRGFRALQSFSFVICQVLSYAIWMQTDWDWLIERTIIRTDGQNGTLCQNVNVIYMYIYINTHINTPIHTQGICQLSLQFYLWKKNLWKGNSPICTDYLVFGIVLIFCWTASISMHVWHIISFAMNPQEKA